MRPGKSWVRPSFPIARAILNRMAYLQLGRGDLRMCSRNVTSSALVGPHQLTAQKSIFPRWLWSICAGDGRGVATAVSTNRLRLRRHK